MVVELVVLQLTKIAARPIGILMVEMAIDKKPSLVVWNNAPSLLIGLGYRIL